MYYLIPCSCHINQISRADNGSELLLMIHVGLTVMRNHRNTPTAMVNSMTSSKQVNKVKPTVNRSTPDNVAVSPNQQPGGGGYNR